MPDAVKALKYYEEQQTQRATGLLTHSIGMLMEKAGLRVDSDTRVELGEISEAIVNAAGARAERERVEALGA